MEIAIPFIALAGAYVISNQSPTNSSTGQKKRLERGLQRIQTDNEGKEGFTGYSPQNPTNNPTVLPNTNIPPQNYPVSNTKQLVDTVQNYANPNAATDKYFDQNLYSNQEIRGMQVGNQIQEVYSLTGNYLDSKEFKHNNMVPFYGGKFKGQVYDMNIAETVLDNMAGTGSQVIKKIEQEPLFKPEDNVQWAFGAPNMSEFYQSRVVPGMKNSNVKPFETEHVGPGLNQGYTTQGSGGYNSGMESRDQWLPKTVDELRVNTNPKMEYSLNNLQGPSYSHVQNVGILGKVEKYHPDTFFINTQDRWLTTTGQEKAQALRPIEEVGYTTRQDTSVSYAGVASMPEKNASYVPSSYTDPKRPQLKAKDVTASSAMGRGPSTDKDAFLKSHTNYANHRATTRQPDTMRSSFTGAIGAVIAPLMDAFRPTRKEEYGDNVRVYGDLGTTVPKSYTLNPRDVPNTTVKETTLYSADTYIGNQASKGVVLHNQQAIENQRDTTNYSHIGNAGSVREGFHSTESHDRQYNNEKLEATQVSYTPQGGTQIYNQAMNVNMAKLDTDRDNNRLWVPQTTTLGQFPVGKEMYGKQVTRQQYDENKIGIDRIQPDLLKSFLSNPYTQSLHSYANF
jgi:hypothetical protein